MSHRIGEKSSKIASGVHALMQSRDINRKLLQAILRLFPTVQACANAFEVEYGSLVKCINLKQSPLRKVGAYSGDDYAWLELCETVAHGLGYSVAELFPPSLYPPPTGIDGVCEGPRIYAAGRRMTRIAVDPQADVITAADRRFMNIALFKLLHRLSFRQREILILRFGLGGEDTYTLEETGIIFHLSVERVRQIEITALVKLKRWCACKFKDVATLLGKYWLESSENPYGPDIDEPFRLPDHGPPPP